MKWCYDLLITILGILNICHCIEHFRGTQGEMVPTTVRTQIGLRSILLGLELFVGYALGLGWTLAPNKKLKIFII